MTTSAFRCVASVSPHDAVFGEVTAIAPAPTLCNGEQFTPVFQLPARPTQRQTLETHYRCVACGARYRAVWPSADATVLQPDDLRAHWVRVE